MAPAGEDVGRPRGAARRRRVRLHCLAFVVAALLLWIADQQTPGGPWFHWPVFAWAVVLAVHYLYVRSTSVNEAWAEERTRTLRRKSYDLKHIRDIRESQRTGRWPGEGGGGASE